MKDQRVYLGHIRDAVDDIASYAAVGRDAFMSERMRQDAVIRKLEIIGEAVKQLSDETRQRRPEIPWQQIAGMRDRLTHAYFAVDLASFGRLSSATSTRWRLPSGPCCPTVGRDQQEVAARRRRWLSGATLREVIHPSDGVIRMTHNCAR